MDQHLRRQVAKQPRHLIAARQIVIAFSRSKNPRTARGVKTTYNVMSKKSTTASYYDAFFRQTDHAHSSRNRPAGISERRGNSLADRQLLTRVFNLLFRVILS